MTCRDSKLTSALTTIARCMTNLEDNQVLRLSHVLQDEMPADTPAPTVQQWNTYIDETVAAYEAGLLRITGGSEDPRARLALARQEIPDARRMYAAERILSRCQRANTAQLEFFNTYARDLGEPQVHAATTFWTYFQDATDSTRLGPSRAFENAFRANPDNSSLFLDRRSLYAYEQMALGRELRRQQGPNQPVVTRQPVRSTAIAEMGYDPASGRLEIVMRTSPDRVYAYRVGQGEWDALAASDSPGRHFVRNIRGNTDYQYDSQTDADAAGVQQRCATCGQWASPNGHYCPLTGSEEDLNADIRAAVRRARAHAAGQAAPAPEQATARMPFGRTRRIPGDLGTLRLPYPNRIRQEARSVAQVNVPVTVATTDGNTVTGLIQVDYNGRGRGYSASPVTEPGDSGTDNLRCTCVEYRTRRHCEHTDAATAATSRLLNGTDAATASGAAAAISAISAPLNAEHTASDSASATVTNEWVGMRTSFADDPAVFQDLYEEARAAREDYQAAQRRGETGEYPVPYLRGTVFGGLGSRGTGRGFGTEIEYGFPDDMSWQDRCEANERIGEELYDLGLTQQREQGYYGESHGWSRDFHEQGWAFEEDPSTGGGGEIISPVMFDEEQTWTNVERVCQVIRRHGGSATTRAGMHVHVGAGDYDHTVANHNRLLAAFTTHEDLIYRLSSEPKRGRHRGMTYCSPNQRPSSPYASVGAASGDNDGHDIGINMENVRGDRGDHIEIRTFDSSVEPGVIQAQIGVAVMMAEGALREGTTDPLTSVHHPVGERLAANPSRGALTGEQWQESTLGVRQFIDTFVPGMTDDDRQNPVVRQLVALFAVTKWQKRRW
jgi:hypothetical protein